MTTRWKSNTLDVCRTADDNLAIASSDFRRHMQEKGFREFVRDLTEKYGHAYKDALQDDLEAQSDQSKLHAAQDEQKRAQNNLDNQVRDFLSKKTLDKLIDEFLGWIDDLFRDAEDFVKDREAKENALKEASRTTQETTKTNEGRQKAREQRARDRDTAKGKSTDGGKTQKDKPQGGSRPRERSRP